MRLISWYQNHKRSLLLLVAVTLLSIANAQRDGGDSNAGDNAVLEGIQLRTTSQVDPENTLSCHRHQYTYKVTETDERGRVCWDHVNILSCWGRCDSNEIADWKFPYKRSHHPVCLHESTKESTAILKNCDPDVSPGTEIHVYTEAAVCACSLCKSSEASCEGLRYRGARRAPRDTSKEINDRNKSFDVSLETLDDDQSRSTKNVLVDGYDGLTRPSKALGNVASQKQVTSHRLHKKNLNKEYSVAITKKSNPYYDSAMKRTVENEIYQFDLQIPREELPQDYHSRYNAEGFKHAEHNHRLGAHGIGVITSRVVSGGDGSDRENIVSGNNYKSSLIYQPKAVMMSQLRNRDPVLTGKHGHPSSYADIDRYVSSDVYSDPNNMRPVLDLKRKRSI